MGLTAQQATDAANQAREQFDVNAFNQFDQGRARQQDFDISTFQAQEQALQQEQALDVAAFQAGEAARQEASRQNLSSQEIQEKVNQAENQARMQARETNNQYRLNQSNLAMQALDSDRASRDQVLRSAEMLGNLGGQDQRMEMERLRNLQASGQNMRDMDQRSLDMGYQDFLRQQAFGRDSLGFFSNILQGIPVTPGTTTSSFGGGPSGYQQALGAGIGGVGLYNALS